MTDLDPTFAAIVKRDRSDECQARSGEQAVHHGLTFETPDGTHLVQLDAPGTMPIPVAGQTIVLHDQPVAVLSAETAYTRTEDGRPTLYTQVVVDTVRPPDATKVREALQAAVRLLAYSAGRAAADDPEHSAHLSAAADAYARHL
ncbi:hypothetical protein [Streptomyces californicus]